MASVAAIVLCGCILGAAPFPTLVVQIDLRVSRSVVSSGIRKIAVDEAKTIWSEYGVAVTRPSEVVRPGLRVDVAVDGTSQSRRIPRMRDTRVLGRTWLADGPGEPSRVRISFDDIESSLAWEPFDGALMHELVVARAVGRVLAHEIGHVLLGSHHDSDGLMRPTFPSVDLARLERSRFRLSDTSLARLRDRVRHVDHDE